MLLTGNFMTMFADVQYREFNPRYRLRFSFLNLPQKNGSYLYRALKRKGK